MDKPRIVSNPKVMTGKPVVEGTRITVELILEKLAAGESIEQILDAHPRLTREAIQVALGFAADALHADVVYPVVEPYNSMVTNWLVHSQFSAGATYESGVAMHDPRSR